MYGKVFESMYEGTLYGKWEAIVTMQQFIVLATADGVVDMTPMAIAARTSIPRKVLDKGIDILSKPDPYSRTPGNDGVRISLIDEHKPWGWYIVNHDKYNKIVKSEDKREADRIRIANKRKSLKEQGCRKVSQSVASVANVAQEEEEENIDKEEETENTALNKSAWVQYEAHRKDISVKPYTEKGKSAAIKIWCKSSHDAQQRAVDDTIANGYTGCWPAKHEVRNETHKRPNEFEVIHAANRKAAGLD